jgi:hypothetical protein
MALNPTYTYVWLADGVVLPNTKNSYVVTAADYHKMISVEVSFTDNAGYYETLTGTASQYVSPDNVAPTGIVNIFGTLSVGSIITADTSTVQDSNGIGTLHYIWKADGVVIPNSPDSQYYTLTANETGKIISVDVNYIDLDYYSEALTGTATGPVIPANVQPTGSITIDGLLIVGSTLTANTSALSDPNGLGTLQYAWKVDGAPISGAYNSTYVVDVADENKLISVDVSYIDGNGYPELVTGVATGNIIPNIAAVGSVAVTGTLIEGETLTATPTITDGNGIGPFHYTWKADGVVVGADSSTYVLTANEAGKTLTATVTFTDAVGYQETIVSAATGVAKLANVHPTGAVVITGLVAVDSTVTADTSGLADINGLRTFTYEWKANNVVIGTNSPTYLLTSAELGKTLTVKVTYTDGDSYPETVTSAASVPVNVANTLPVGTVTITGNLVSGQTLTAGAVITDANGIGLFHYNWKANGAAIGTDNSSYVLTDSEVGKAITCEVTFTDGVGYNEKVIGTTVGVVKASNVRVTGAVTIDGLVAVDSTLTANTSALVDPNGIGTLHYQWKANGVAIGTDSATYLLTLSELGKIIAVDVSYTDNDGYSENVTGATTVVVKPANVLPTGSVTITGLLAVDSIITADTSTLADTNLLGNFHYEWKADGTTIGTDSATYKLTTAELGKTITVTVTYTDGDAYNESVTSATSVTVIPANVLPTGSVTITGLLAVDSTITADTTTLVDANILGPFHYEWKADGTTIGTDSATYLLTASELGKLITVDVTYTDGDSYNEKVTATASANVKAANVLPTGSVNILGALSVGSTLTANTGSLVDANILGPFHYAWKAGGNAIGADSATYIVTASELGKLITVDVTYTDGDGYNESVTGTAAGVILAANVLPTGNVTITGTATVGSTLTADISTLADANGLGTFHYQWKADTAVIGTDSATYILTASEVGKAITVTVTYTDGVGYSESVTSAATSLVA